MPYYAELLQVPFDDRYQKPDLTPEQWKANVLTLLSDQLYATTDMSSNYACFSLTGPAARTVLAMGCGIDMHPGAFMAGQCARTHFANVLLLIVAVEDNRFDLYVDRSHARYLSGWLVNSGEDPITRERMVE